MITIFQRFFEFVFDIYKSRKLLVQLAKRDFQSRYLGSYLGLLWAFIQPSVTIVIFWFVFQVGFKARPVDDYPFILWLLTGIVPWFFFAEAWGSATSSVMEYSFLVNKVVFRVSLLPLIKILSALVIHFFFIAVIFIFFFTYGYDLSLYSIQVIYYLFALIVLVVGLAWFTSALVVFLKDVGEIIAMFIQFGFWGTPIFWSINMIPERYRIIMKLNPVFYITEGYRESFIYNIWFWEHWKMSIYFWCVTLFIFFAGALVFKKLRPHFSDVL